jgi:hypothetical protein
MASLWRGAAASVAGKASFRHDGVTMGRFQGGVKTLILEALRQPRTFTRAFA